MSSEFSFQSQRMISEWWGVLVASTLLILAISYFTPPVRTDNLFYDLVLRVSPPKPSNDVIIVAIDNNSLAELGQWPWPRDVHARLINNLTDAGAAVIGYDILFTEASDPEVDAKLARAIERHGNVVLPSIIEVPGADGAASQTIRPISSLANAARFVAHVVTRPDRDGVVRGVDRLTDDQGRFNLHFGVAVGVLACGDEYILERPKVEDGGPIIALKRDLIPFAGPAGSFARFSFADVVEGRVPTEMLKGKTILVGSTASGLGDRFSTPMSGTLETMAGVELHANYVNALIKTELIYPVSPFVWLLFSLIPLWILMISLLFLGTRVNLWLGVGLGGGIFLLTCVSLIVFELWLPPALALLSIGVIYPLWGWRRLDMASQYMLAELRNLRSEPTLLPRHRGALQGDPVLRQISLMHEAIQDIRDLRQFVAQSLDNLPDAAIVTDLDGHVLIANDAAEALFVGRVKGNIHGQHVRELLRSMDADLRMPDPHAVEFLLHIASYEGTHDYGYEKRLTDGTSLEIKVARFDDANGHPLGWIARFVDITLLRASERQREDALRLLTHDMRSPQASILAILQSEGRDIPPAVSQRLQRYAHQTLALADDFVHLARAESGRFVVEAFNLADAMLDSVDDLWPLAKAKMIRIATEVGEDELMVVGDRSLLTRSLTNILGNAIKYSDQNTCITARSFLMDGRAVCEIEDQGRGIAEDDLKILFEPFQRLAPPEGSTPQADAQGAGLGLAFVKAVVERHRGEIFVRSVEGQGSTFGMKIPLEDG